MSLSSSPASLFSPTLPATPPPADLHDVQVASSESAVEDSPICVGQRVRFDVDCVLIPEPSPVSRMPRLVTKSYSVPLWRRRAPSQEPSAVSDSEADAREDEHVVLKVHVPSITMRTRSPSHSEPQPLVPCLVQHHHHHDVAPEFPSTAVPRRRPTRTASVSSSPRPAADLATVPLRPCCTDCVHSTEACLRSDVNWQEKFTRGALRLRRRASTSDARYDYNAHRRLAQSIPGFDAVVDRLAVDEVDKLGKKKGFVSEEDVFSEEEDRGVLLPSLARATSSSMSLGRLETRQVKTPFHAKASADAEPTFSRSISVDNLASTLSMSGHPVLSESRSAHRLPARSPEPENASSYVLLPGNEPHHALSSPEMFPDSPEMSPDSTPVHIRSWSSRSEPSILEGRDRLFHENASRPPPNRRRAHINIPGPATFLKVSAEMLKGVSLSGGTPLSV